MSVQEHINQILRQVADVTEADLERAEELFEKTVDTVEERSAEDDLIKIENREDAELVALAGILMLSKDDREDQSFEDHWEEFAEEMTGFDIGLMYTIAFEDRAEETIKEIHRDFGSKDLSS